MFYDVFVARGNDVSEIAKLARRHGYDNPGPIVSFPPNEAQFPRGASPGAVRGGARILVPWHPNLLRKLIATQEHLAVQVAQGARELIQKQDVTKEKLEQFRLLVGSACMLINVGKGIGELVAHGVKHGEMTAGQLVSWFINSRLEMASDITTLVVPAPSQSKKDFRFFIRHTLGPWTPSFWASVYVAVTSGDVDTYLYGPAAVQYQTLLTYATRQRSIKAPAAHVEPQSRF
jgi:hypothetical protein